MQASKMPLNQSQINQEPNNGLKQCKDMDSPREPFETMHRHGPSILSSRYKVSLEVNNMMLPSEMITHPYMHVFG